MKTIRVWWRYLRRSVYETRLVWRRARWDLLGPLTFTGGCLAVAVSIVAGGSVLLGAIWFGLAVWNGLNAWNVWRHEVVMMQVRKRNELRARQLATWALTVTPPAPPKPLPRRESDERVIGYRMWRLAVDNKGVGLASIAALYVWDGPVVRDEKPPAERPIGAFPQVNTPFGFHAYSTPDMGADAVYLAQCEEMGVPVVQGAVQLYGTVVRHEHGFRAQAAIVKSLVVPAEFAANAPEILKALGRRYACPVVVSTDPRSSLLLER